MKNLRLLFFALFLGCFLPVSSYAQGIFIPPRVVTGTVNGITRPIAGATVTVCAANTAGIPCSPALANTVFKDQALTVPLSNPFTTDANGNYPQAALAGGVYTITESAAGFAGFSYQATVSCAAGAPCTITGPFTVSGSAIITALTAGSYNTIRIMVDQLPGADNGAKYNACIAQIGTGSGICDGSNLTAGQITTTINVIANSNRIVLILPFGESWGTINPIINLGGTVSCATVLGQGDGLTALKVNAVNNDAILVGSTLQTECTKIEGMSFGVHSTLTRTGGAAIHAKGGVTVSDIAFPTFGTFYGILLDTTTSALNAINPIYGDNGSNPFSDPNGNWQAVVQFGPVLSCCNTGSILQMAGSYGATTDAIIAVDGFTDSLRLWTLNLASTSAGSGRVLHIEKTAGGDPTWIKVVGGILQGLGTGSTSNVVQVDAGVGIDFVGTWASLGVHGLAVSGGQVQWTGGQIQTNNQDGVVLTGGTLRLNGAHITNNGTLTNNTYDDVNVAANVNNFTIVNNDFTPLGAAPANKEKYGIEVKAGTSDGYTISGNDFTGASPVTANLIDGGTGVHKFVCNPGSYCANGPATSFGGDVVASRTSSTGVILLGNSNTVDYGVTTAGTYTFTNGPVSLPSYKSNTNCQLGGAAGTTSPASCGAAPAGMIAVPASQTTYQVNTTAVTANSEIIVQQITDNSGLPSSPTCNAGATTPIQSSRSAATSFTITLTSVASVTCFKYWIIN